MYADEISLLSDPDKGLQRSLDVLNKCSNWKVDVNHETSKVMVFNSNGNSYLKIFKCQDNAIETVKSYYYLSVAIRYSGGIGGSSNLLMEKDRKLLLRLKNLLG